MGERESEGKESRTDYCEELVEWRKIFLSDHHLLCATFICMPGSNVWPKMLILPLMLQSNKCRENDLSGPFKQMKAAKKCGLWIKVTHQWEGPAVLLLRSGWCPSGSQVYTDTCLVYKVTLGCESGFQKGWNNNMIRQPVTFRKLESGLWLKLCLLKILFRPVDTK